MANAAATVAASLEEGSYSRGGQSSLTVRRMRQTALRGVSVTEGIARITARVVYSFFSVTFDIKPILSLYNIFSLSHMIDDRINTCKINLFN